MTGRKGSAPPARGPGTTPVFGDAMALAAGLMAPFAFAPFGLGWLSIIALALLFHAVTDITPRRGFWRGWLFGLAMFGTGVFWIHESFRFAAVALPLAFLLTGALVMLLALYPALFGTFAALLSTMRAESGRHPGRRSAPALLLLGLPAAWVLLEWARGWLFGGFPWLQMGYAHTDSLLAGFAPLLGVYGVGWAGVFSAGLVLWALRVVINAGREAGWSITKISAPTVGKHLLAPRALLAPLTLLVPLAIGAGLWAGAAALGEIPWTTPTGPEVRIAIVQGNIPQDIKWRPEQRQPTLDRYLSLTRQAPGRDLVVWPETALPGFYQDFQGFIAGLRREAGEHGTHILMGLPFAESGPGKHGPGKPYQYFNTVVAITGEEGQVPGGTGEGGELFYHKRHLVPFGEYLPMAGVLRGAVDFLQIPMSDFSPGPRMQPPLPVAGQRIGVSICYEAAFGRDIISPLPQATLLVNVSNDAWFGDSRGPHQNLQMARMRARETGRYLLRGTNTGISALVDPGGRVMETVPQFRTAVLTGTVTGMIGETPYVRYGDWVAVLLALVALMAALYAAGGVRIR